MKENISYQKLPRSFYLDDTVNVAKSLLASCWCGKSMGKPCLLSSAKPRLTPDFLTKPATPIRENLNGQR